MSRIDIVALARQTAGMGTKVTTMEYGVPVEESAPDQSRDEMTIEETVGDRFPTGLDYGTRFFTVPLRGAPRMSSLPRILSGFVGLPATVAGAGADVGAYTHTHDPSAAGKVPEPHSIFVVRKDPSTPIVDLFWDARGNEITLSVAPNDFLKMDANYIALDLDDTQAAPTPTQDVSQRRKFTDCIGEISLDAGTTWTAMQLANWQITYSNALDTDEAVLGSRKLYALPYGNANCEVRFSPRETLNTHYRRALLADPTTVAIRLTATGPALVVPGGTLFSKVQVYVRACETIEAPAHASGADVLKSIEVRARAKKDLTGKFVDFVVVNGVASY